MKRTLIAAAALAVAAAISACSGASGGTTQGAATAGPPATTAPAAAAWRLGGTYTGPVPPPSTTGLPGPSGSWQLPLYTSPDGYKLSDRLILGVPLHYDIPQVLEDCNTAYPEQRGDLPPGQYVIPFEMRIQNETGQQAPAMIPQFWAKTENTALQVTGADDRDGLWQDGSCSLNNGIQLNADGSTAFYGFVGPATPQQLAGAVAHVSWATGNNVPGTPPELSQPLAQVLPSSAVAWLKSHGGTVPQAAPSVSASPTSCPSAPAGYDSEQQIAFNGSCGTWLGNLDEQLQWDNGNPARAEADYCKGADDTQVEGEVMTHPEVTQAQIDARKAHLLTACIAGTKAAGAP